MVDENATSSRKDSLPMTIPALPLPKAADGTPVDMPLLGFGTWQIRGDAAYQAVRDALEAGYRHLDTATMYGNEAEVGRALRDSGVPREEVFVTTKLPPERAGRERATLDASLRALGVDAIDLWLIHWPPSRRLGQGLARVPGRPRRRSDPRGRRQQLRHRRDRRVVRGDRRAAGGQPDPLRPALWDPAEVAAHRERGIVVEGYSPFKTTNLHDPVLTGSPTAHGVDPARVVLRWHIQHEIVVIPKSKTPERIARNADLDGFTLSADEMAAIDGLSRHRRRVI